MTTAFDTTARISIVMVTYGAADWVARSLDAVEAHTNPSDYELVVVDNGGPDPAARALLTDRYGDGRERADGVARVVVHRAATNLGFSAGNNLGANLATAPVLCLLNSDALVGTGWLAPLLTALAEPGIGAVAPVLCELDGRVQEAGANIEPDGRVEAFGRGLAVEALPTTPWTVPYASAACLLVRTSDYRAVGGLDCGYGLGYYEDADLACELLRRGLRTVVVPEVRVVHARGASVPDHGTSLERARRNQQRFVSRQSGLLADRWHTLDPVAQPRRVAAARDITAPRRAFVVGPVDGPALDRLRDDYDLVTFDGPRQTVARSGVEHVGDAAQCLTDRPFHYDAVVADAGWFTEYDELLTTHHPAAHRLPR